MNISKRPCLREPIPEIADAAQFLDAAVSAHLMGEIALVEDLIRLADLPAIREWTESIWGKNSPYVQYRQIESAESDLASHERQSVRMPTVEEKRRLHQRDGYHCRFCGIPVIRAEVRQQFVKSYPHLELWGRANSQCHAAFQAMWAQYDHLLPHARGGGNELWNIFITCAPCNDGRMSYPFEEVNLEDPRSREPIHSQWDGLERFR